MQRATPPKGLPFRFVALSFVPRGTGLERNFRKKSATRLPWWPTSMLSGRLTTARVGRSGRPVESQLEALSLPRGAYEHDVKDP